MADSQNGETKIDIENLRSAFVGMGKEELMKYANDPFWVKMRWFLFILFWLLWFGMLSGAIAIIVLAPKCAAPTPKEWYEQNPIYEINSRDSSNADSIIDLAVFLGMKENIEYFEELGVKTILLDSVLKSKKDNPNFVEDFMSVDPTLGTGDDFKKFLAMLKEKGIRLLMSLVPNYSSDTHMWFEKSVAKEEPYKDYYIWVPAKGKGTDGQPLPPNNWVSVNGGSAWEWNNARGEFYLHQFDKSQPDLNFRNQALIDYFKDVFKYWLDMGVSGFYLDRVEYLIEDASFKNEPINPDTGATHDQYEFYIHKQTTDLPETVHLLKDWGSFVRNHSGLVFSCNFVD
ncbi:hypothetical protein AAG570_007664 [Ranatra chinensis]|uniref:alpha-glucosidase n=1 Tax=Ranatra chinensis TaxID=642074 RepID=A0ABD0XW53_9HEMI